MVSQIELNLFTEMARYHDSYISLIITKALSCAGKIQFLIDKMNTVNAKAIILLFQIHCFIKYFLYKKNNFTSYELGVAAMV